MCAWVCDGKLHECFDRIPWKCFEWIIWFWINSWCLNKPDDSLCYWMKSHLFCKFWVQIVQWRSYTDCLNEIKRNDLFKCWTNFSNDSIAANADHLIEKVGKCKHFSNNCLENLEWSNSYAEILRKTNENVSKNWFNKFISKSKLKLEIILIETEFWKNWRTSRW